MNDRLRSILHKAWNEPRHFFFSLVVLSIGGLVAAAVGFAAVDSSLPGPMLLLAFVTLGCLVCLAVSFPAFILAWIPPVRRLFSRLLSRRLLLLGCVVTLVALFYAVEDWRGRRAWQAYKHDREARGERLDLASFVPPPVPADQNFFETPVWDFLRFVRTNGITVWGDTNWQDHVVLSAFGPEAHNDALSQGSWVKGERVDLSAWQAFYRGTNNLFSAGGGTPTHYFPVAKEPQTPAADVLLALGKFETNRQLLIAASARPQARFWINYDGGYAAMLPHLGRIKACVLYLTLHANAALKAGDRETASEDMRLSFRLIAAIQGEPVLISHLVRIAMLQRLLQPVWEGLADRQWTDADLSTIETELGKLDFLADYQRSISSERAAGVWGVDYIRKEGLYEVERLISSGREPGPGELKKFFSKALYQLIPAGWFDQNKLSLCRLHEKYLLPLVLAQDRRVAPSAAIQESNAILENQGSRPYDMFSHLLVVSLGRAAGKFACAQSSADLARVACALERYRLANNQFPDSLDALAPRFIARLPHDVVNGEPLKYRRTDDGQFVLYSVGENGMDDGGKVELTKAGRASFHRSDLLSMVIDSVPPTMTKPGNAEWHEGDWVWRYPAK